MPVIELHFINVADRSLADGVDGYVFADFFKDEGLARAERADADEASRILAITYKGADTEGVGVEWSVYAD